jgi:hypothetical protein
MVLRSSKRWTARLRIAALLGAVSLCAAVSSLRAAEARARELANSAGEAMLRYSEAEHIDETRALNVNGIVLHVSSGSSQRSVDEVLDFFHDRCQRAGAAFAHHLLQAAGAGPTPQPREHLLDATLRAQDDQRGHLACLDLGSEKLGVEELMARLRAFITTLDVSRVGELRFVWARREHNYTKYVAMWTAGSLSLREAFPETGDAPGVDLDELPRPHGAQRVLSAYQQDRAPLLLGYRALGTVTEVEKRYREQLSSHGFAVRSEPLDAGGRWLSIIGPRGAALALLTTDARGGARVSLVPLH